ncbi:MAG: nuclear transport factor 2 family protein, partial [Allomuricauda sp.]
MGMVNAQSDYELIEQTLGYYMEGGSNRDFNTLKKAFHETATMKYITEEGYKEVNALEFFSGMKTGNRVNRKNRIAEITVSGHAANARLELEYPDFTFVDFMNLLKIDGEWKIVNKIFYKRVD